MASTDRQFCSLKAPAIIPRSVMAGVTTCLDHPIALNRGPCNIEFKRSRNCCYLDELQSLECPTMHQYVDQPLACRSSNGGNRHLRNWSEILVSWNANLAARKLWIIIHRANQPAAWERQTNQRHLKSRRINLWRLACGVPAKHRYLPFGQLPVDLASDARSKCRSASPHPKKFKWR